LASLSAVTFGIFLLRFNREKFEKDMFFGGKI
jgi:hypothetical protein